MSSIGGYTVSVMTTGASTNANRWTIQQLQRPGQGLLDADTEQIIRQLMRTHRVSFKQALNDAIRDADTAGTPSEPFRTLTTAMGEPQINLDQALQLAGKLEDEELIRKMRRGV